MRKLTISGLLLGLVVLSGVLIMGSGSGEAERLRDTEANQTEIVAPLKAQGATEQYIDLWFALMVGDVPEITSGTLPDGMIDRRFGVQPRPTEGYNRYSCLLDIALRHRNIEGVKALLEAGADPNQAGYAFATTALPGPGGAPDWGTSPAILALYLEHGGNLDYARPDSDDPMFMLASWSGNTPGAQFLIEQGADPWARNRRHEGEADVTAGDRYGIAALANKGTENLKAFVLWFVEAGYLDTADGEKAAPFIDGIVGNYQVIAAGETMMDDGEIALKRDIIAASLKSKHDYRVEDRRAAVAALSAYLDRRAARP